MIFYSESLLSIRKRSANFPTNIYKKQNSARPYKKIPQTNHNVVLNVNTNFESSRIRCRRWRSLSPLVKRFKLLHTRNSSASSDPDLTTSMACLSQSFCEVFYDTSHLTPECGQLSNANITKLEAISYHNMQKLSNEEQPDRRSPSHYCKN